VDKDIPNMVNRLITPSHRLYRWETTPKRGMVRIMWSTIHVMQFLGTPIISL